MGDTGDHPATGPIGERVARMEGKVRDLERGTKAAFQKVDGSLERLDGTLTGTNMTLALINERMVTKADCTGKQETCVGKQSKSLTALDTRLDTVELEQKAAQITKDLTDPNFKVPRKNGMTPEKAKKWIGVAAAVLGLLGFGTVSTCVSNTMGDLRSTMQQTQKQTARGIRETREELRQIRSAPQMQVPLPLPLIVPADGGLSRDELRLIERRRKYLHNAARRRAAARKRRTRSAPASQPHH